MIDLSDEVTADVLKFYSDASASKEKGFGCILDDQWIYGKWGSDFISKEKLTIEYLELFAMCAGLLTWEDDCTPLISLLLIRPARKGDQVHPRLSWPKLLLVVL